MHISNIVPYIKFRNYGFLNFNLIVFNLLRGTFQIVLNDIICPYLKHLNSSLSCVIV